MGKSKKLTAFQRYEIAQGKKNLKIKAWVKRQKKIDMKEMVAKFNIQIKIWNSKYSLGYG